MAGSKILDSGLRRNDGLSAHYETISNRDMESEGFLLRTLRSLRLIFKSLFTDKHDRTPRAGEVNIRGVDPDLASRFKEILPAREARIDNAIPCPAVRKQR